MLTMTDLDIALRGLGFSFDGLRLLDAPAEGAFVHPDLPGKYLAADGLAGDPLAFAAALAGLPATLTERERLARDAAAVAGGRTPIELATLQLAEMLERALADTREWLNRLRPKLAALGVDLGDLPPLPAYPSFEAAVQAWRAALEARAGEDATSFVGVP